MDVLQAIVLGIVQGISEFLPISSSGHLVILPRLFEWGEGSMFFDVMVHVGTLLAVVVAMRREVVDVVRGKMTVEGIPMYALLLASAVPALIVGWFFADTIETVLRGPIIVAIGLIYWGLVLWWVDRLSKKNVDGGTQSVRWKQVLWMSLAQVLALVPGTSRSGITMIAGMDSGLSRVTASKVSFLMAIPAIAVAGGYQLLQAVLEGGDVAMVPLVAGMVASFVSGVLAIKLLLAFVARASFFWFALYRVALGVFIIAWFI